MNSQARPLFILMPLGRVGSNLLVGILNAHEGIKLANEPFTAIRSTHPKTIDGDLASASKQAAWLADLSDRIQQTDAPRYLGAKLALVHFVQPISFLRKMVELQSKFIFMYRDNYVKTAISIARSNTSKLWGVTSPDQILPPQVYNPGELLQHIKHVHNTTEMYRWMLRTYKVEYLAIEYNQIANDLESTCKKIEDHLELEGLIPKVKFIKGTDDDLSKVILNFDEIRATLRGTEYEKMLTENCNMSKRISSFLKSRIPLKSSISS